MAEPHPQRALRSSLTIGSAYIVGGVIPLAPYLWPLPVANALLISAIVTLIALGLFGWGKSRATGLDPWRGALQTMVVGGLAAGVAYVIAHVISGLSPAA